MRTVRATSLMRDQCCANWELAPENMEEEWAMEALCGKGMPILDGLIWWSVEDWFDLMAYDSQRREMSI